MDPKKNVPTEHVFHFLDGKKAHNLHDLRDALATIDEETFGHHVDAANNDFANWVEFVYRKPQLAADMRAVSTAKQIVELIDAELGRYSGEAVQDPSVPDVEQPQPFANPVKATPPPQTITTHDGKEVHTISTQATHTFIVKEFIWGLITGLLLGIIIMAVLMQLGVMG